MQIRIQETFVPGCDSKFLEKSNIGGEFMSDELKQRIVDIGKKTIIMVSHSLLALCKCEKIYKLDKNILKIQNKNS